MKSKIAPMKTTTTDHLKKIMKVNNVLYNNLKVFNTIQNQYSVLKNKYFSCKSNFFNLLNTGVGLDL